MLEHKGKILLIDANADNLMQTFPSGSIDRILLTHYHMDHVHSLFDLRWGVNQKIPVDGPNDPNGCDDLFKHPGILAFQAPLSAFQHFEWQGITITPLPMIHSKICFGYCFELNGKRIAYLTDTYGLAIEVVNWLKTNRVDLMLIDCSYPPVEQGQPERKNHNDLNIILKLQQQKLANKIGLIHIDHSLDTWALTHPEQFDHSLFLAKDKQGFSI